MLSRDLTLVVCVHVCICISYRSPAFNFNFSICVAPGPCHLYSSKHESTKVTSIDNSPEQLNAYQSGFLLFFFFDHITYSPVSLDILINAIKCAFTIFAMFYLTSLDICSGRDYWDIWTIILAFSTGLIDPAN